MPFEKKETETGIVCRYERRDVIFGRFWCGKTTLDRYAASVWERNGTSSAGRKAEKELEEVLCKHHQKVMKLDGDSMSDKLLDSLMEKIVVLSPERIEIKYVFTDLMRMQERIMIKQREENDERICGEVSEDIR